jgi:hypothetical protein
MGITQSTNSQGQPIVAPSQNPPGYNPFSVPVTVRVGLSPPWTGGQQNDMPPPTHPGQEEPLPKTCLQTWKGFLCTILALNQFINGIIASFSSTTACIAGGVILTMGGFIVFFMELPQWIPAVTCSLQQSNWLENRFWVKTLVYVALPVGPVIFIKCGGGAYIFAFITSVGIAVIYSVVFLHKITQKKATTSQNLPVQA